MSSEPNCKAPGESWSGTKDCREHHRTELWHEGRIVAWCGFEVGPEARQLWFNKFFGVG